ncbi:unnamed protein product [Adineta ricciae]|uniref:Uncharacterized protein n=1 Tax=Adineta ricciae TaxID=249248 RepID=A0A815ULD6_ADIRI|nr:unnamed protein product [Adineta ricciae]
MTTATSSITTIRSTTINTTGSTSISSTTTSTVLITTLTSSTTYVSSTSSTSTTTSASTISSTTTTTQTTTTTTVSRCQMADFGRLLTQSGPTSWFQFSYTYIATSIEPTLRFIFDGGPADCSYLDNISITDNNAPSVQLLSNPSFENSTSSPVGWNVANSSTCQSGTQGQVITSGCQTSSGNNCFKAYCVRGYEYLFQSFNAIIGDFYTISFWLEQTGGPVACIYVDVI